MDVIAKVDWTGWLDVSLLITANHCKYIYLVSDWWYLLQVLLSVRHVQTCVVTL